MSEIQESNICPICGGLIQFEYVFTFDRCKPFSIRVEPASLTPFTFCPGHPEPEQKHDGNLGEEYAVRYDDVTVGMDAQSYAGLPWRHVQGVWIAGMDDFVALTPQQALSLLDWLRQEEQTLQKLVLIQEQEDE